MYSLDWGESARAKELKRGSSAASTSPLKTAGESTRVEDPSRRMQPGSTTVSDFTMGNRNVTTGADVEIPQGHQATTEEGDELTDLDRISPPARPLADGTDADSSTASWERVTLSGSGGGSVQYQGVEEEAGGNLTGGPSHTRADATAADIPSAAQVMSPNATHAAKNMNQDVNMILTDLYQQLESTKVLEDDILEKLHATIERVQKLETMYSEDPAIPSWEELDDCKKEMATPMQQEGTTSTPPTKAKIKTPSESVEARMDHYQRYMEQQIHQQVSTEKLDISYNMKIMREALEEQVEEIGQAVRLMIKEPRFANGKGQGHSSVAESEYRDFKDSVWARFRQCDAALTECQRKTQARVEMSTLQATIDALKNKGSTEGMGIPRTEQPNTPRRDDPWEQGCSAQDPTVFFNLREFIVNVLQQETLDKFMDLENKELQLRDELDGHLRKIEAEHDLLKSNEPGTTPYSNAGLPVEWRVFQK